MAWSQFLYYENQSKGFHSGALPRTQDKNQFRTKSLTNWPIRNLFKPLRHRDHINSVYGITKNVCHRGLLFQKMPTRSYPETADSLKICNTNSYLLIPFEAKAISTFTTKHKQRQSNENEHFDRLYDNVT